MTCLLNSPIKLARWGKRKERTEARSHQYLYGSQILRGCDAHAVKGSYRVALFTRGHAHADLVSPDPFAQQLPGAVARIAGILHMFEHAGRQHPWEVLLTEPTMEAAITLGDYFTSHGKAAYALMGADGRMEDARKVWATIDRQGWESFSQRDLYLHVRRSFSVDRLAEVLEALASMGYIRRPVDTPTRATGRPSIRWEVNPMGRTQSTQNPQKEDLGATSEDSEDSVYEEPL